ncbi:type VI secretion system tube protein TssD [Psychrosphaera sp. 1_MG-2023]|uniref:Type VI secretion system tube protein TssD n=1 Tax=Psychrosphaera algicola TaxID=3023714 RepID=A0ABT5FGG6_9GAMM|nr:MULTISPECIES: type VI secretion system tube protein TssD [unclassified Psychrosphaera]MDC2890177.1 type VI secretion system tube protein TssD [Psychrosphaera sp. G1-22]MDO6721401.1 type VI secretion system tube protein TssD [Psychrosphaera sp. 1_MG-2023]
MAMIGFLTLRGDIQGVIEGSSRYEGNETEIEVLKFDHQIEIPRSANNQVSSGQIVHRGIQINKLVDKSTPKLAQALDNREVLSEVVLSWYVHTTVGDRELMYRIKLENALLTKIETWSPHLYDTQHDGYRLMENLTISYEKIIWSYGSDGDVEYETQAKGAD